MIGGQSGDMRVSGTGIIFEAVTSGPDVCIIGIFDCSLYKFPLFIGDGFNSFISIDVVIEQFIDEFKLEPPRIVGSRLCVIILSDVKFSIKDFVISSK
jgi:hypothetical protein